MYSYENSKISKQSERIDSRRNMVQKTPNKTGLPDNLKVGIESRSGVSLDDVRIHYNSSKPAQLQAYAYTVGTDIHVAPGQESHLPHEAWHVVQQKQGRVKPTIKQNGVNINNDPSLEREADINGRQALSSTAFVRGSYKNADITGSVVQLDVIALNNPLPAGHDYVIGVNFMPGGGLQELIPGNGRGYSLLSDKIAGHSSIVSWYTGQNAGGRQFFMGKGFSPLGLINSLKVGAAGFLPAGLSKLLGIDDPIVQGDYHDDDIGVVEDRLARQLVIHVSRSTFLQWRIEMANQRVQLNNGMYSFKPQSAIVDFFGGAGNDNCTTVAIRNAFRACDTIKRSINRQINQPNQQNNVNQLNQQNNGNQVQVLENDLVSIVHLQCELANMMNTIVEKNRQRGTTKGTQGRAMATLREFFG